MMSQQILKNILPGVVTGVAMNCPVTVIHSISFHIKNKMIAACFWNKKNQPGKKGQLFNIEKLKSVCYIYNSVEDITSSDVEISGTDDQGRNIYINLPYHKIINFRMAS